MLYKCMTTFLVVDRLGHKIFKCYFLLSLLMKYRECSQKSLSRNARKDSTVPKTKINKSNT